MIEYKVIKEASEAELELKINKLAKDYYKLHSFSPVVIPGDKHFYESVWFVAVLEKEM